MGFYLSRLAAVACVAFALWVASLDYAPFVRWMQVLTILIEAWTFWILAGVSRSLHEMGNGGAV